MTEREKNYYMAIIRPENLEQLAEAGLSYYAVKRTSSVGAMTPGDRIILYRSRGTTKREGPGIVGAFEVAEPPRAPDRLNRGMFLALYPVVVPWKPIAISVDNPLPIAPLVPQLRMFPDKQRYGSSLQTTLKRLAKSDYDILEAALKEHCDVNGRVTADPTP